MLTPKGDPYGYFRWWKKSIFCVFSGKVLPYGSEKPWTA
jgi:hypothetical protein